MSRRPTVTVRLTDGDLHNIEEIRHHMLRDRAGYGDPTESRIIRFALWHAAQAVCAANTKEEQANVQESKDDQ